MNKQTLQDNRHFYFREKWLKATENNAAYIQLNMTKNTCGESYFEYAPVHALNTAGTIDDFLLSVAQNIVSEELRRDFLMNHSTSAYEQDLLKGVLSKNIKFPLFLKERGVHWFHLMTELDRNPDTNDLEVFAIFTDIDYKIRLDFMIDRILAHDYEYLCQIDVYSGYFTRLGKTAEDHISLEKNGQISYQDAYQKAVETLLPAEYWAEGIQALSLDKIIEELKENEIYFCEFPVSNQDGKGERICQWRCEYADPMHSTILMTRTNISKILDSGYDALTGMRNRNGFYLQAQKVLDKNPGREYYLIELDFDNFKLVNEEQGHTESNRLLRHFGAKIRRKIKLLQGALTAHYEADHFAILLPRDHGLSPEALYRFFSEQLTTYHNADRLVLRMGVCEFKSTSLNFPLICDCACLALKCSKTSFSNHIYYYSEELKDRILEEEILLSEMQNALETGQFQVWLQPQVNHAKGGALIGAEALVRWSHPERGLISPATFIPLFERSDAIYELDKYVWRSVCKWIRYCLDIDDKPLPISVNVSRVDLLQSDFLDTIVSIVEEENIPYELLHLEITESAFSENEGKVVKIVRKLISLGFTIAIDDFGSGYSSLNLLEYVPAHILKLDMGFFRDSSTNLRKECIVESIIRMAKMLGMSVLAEGVESVEQADFLCSVGCIYIQGYLYSKPLPLSDYMAYFNEKQKEQKEMLGNLTIQPRSQRQVEKNQAYDLFHSILSGSNDMIMVADFHTKQLLYANRAAERYYRKSFDPMETIKCTEYCNQSDLCQNCPANGLVLGEKKELVLSDNGRHMKTLYSRTEWNGHEAFIFYQTDLTQEMCMLEHTDRLFRNIPGAIMVFSQENGEAPRVNYISELAQATFLAAGVDKKLPSYADFLSAIHPDDKNRVHAAAKRTFREKCDFKEELRVLLKNGNVLWIDMRINPVKDEDGNYLFYSMYTDITESRNAQIQNRWA